MGGGVLCLKIRKSLGAIDLRAEVLFLLGKVVHEGCIPSKGLIDLPLHIFQSLPQSCLSSLECLDCSSALFKLALQGRDEGVPLLPELCVLLASCLEFIAGPFVVALQKIDLLLK